MTLKSLPNDKILDMTKLNAFADDRINVAQVIISAFDRLENIVGKGENAGYKHFLLFSTMVSNFPNAKVKLQEQISSTHMWFRDMGSRSAEICTLLL